MMAFCALFMTSCVEAEPAVLTEVSVKNSEVSSEKGSMFVNVSCSGDWQLILRGQTAEVDWAALSQTEGTGNKTNVVLTYQENTTDKNRTLEILITSGDNWSTCQVTQKSKSQGSDLENDRGDDDEEGIPQDQLPQDVVVDVTKAQWMELPAMDDPALGYYSHNFKMNGNVYRNYSFGWSQKDRVALWVAYPLSTLYTRGNVGRTNAWALDPLLGELSAAPFGGYAGSYARGHQLPSADRQCSREANAQTFYGTNMTPQLDEHNEGIWSNLESKVRVIANASDTTYVVTGVIVSASSKKETDSYGNSVTIPDAYFKALLRYSRSSTIAQWSAAAFYLEHRKYNESISKSHSMSIDKLEELTGLDLFVNLPAMVGDDMAAKIEAQDPANSSVWW